MQKKLFLAALAVSSCTFTLSPVLQSPVKAEVPASIQQGITDATDTIQALDGLAFAALTVALMPLGAMLTLRFLNMVLSRV